MPLAFLKHMLAPFFRRASTQALLLLSTAR
jgi:hypothetical protein